MSDELERTSGETEANAVGETATAEAPAASPFDELASGSTPVAEMISEPPAEPAAAADAAEVAPLTASDIPALEGCDVEKSWSGDETCPGTEAVTPEIPPGETPVDPETGSGLEQAEGEVEAAAAAEQPETLERVVHRTSTWPFIVYLVLWAALSVFIGWQLMQVPSVQSLVLSQPYRWAILGGVMMTVAGPLLILAVWLVEWFRAGDKSKAGLLASSLLKGSIATFLGVIMWWGTFLIVDQARIGRFF